MCCFKNAEEPRVSSELPAYPSRFWSLAAWTGCFGALPRRPIRWPPAYFRASAVARPSECPRSPARLLLCADHNNIICHNYIIVKDD